MKRRKFIIWFLIIIVVLILVWKTPDLKLHWGRIVFYGWSTSFEDASRFNISLLYQITKRYHKENEKYPTTYDELLYYEPAIGRCSTSPLEKDGTKISYEILSNEFDPNYFPIIYEKKPYLYKKYHLVALPCGALVLAKTKDLELILDDYKKIKMMNKE